MKCNALETIETVCAIAWICLGIFFIILLVSGCGVQEQLNEEKAVNNAEKMIMEERFPYRNLIMDHTLAELRDIYKIYNMPGSPHLARQMLGDLLMRVCYDSNFAPEDYNFTFDLGEYGQSLNVTTEQAVTCFVECVR